MSGQTWWGARQWAAYLEYMDLPVMESSKEALRELEAGADDAIPGQAYAALLLNDPLLALRLLKEANHRLPRHLARDITTPLGVVLALGTQQFRAQVESAPTVTSDNAGFMNCESRDSLAARVALAWGGLRHDLDPGELAMAALLANAGEIELWAFAPEIPQKALDELTSGRATRSYQAQQQACGFSFMDITLHMIEDWGLPLLIKQLVRGDEGMRACMARLAVNTARHLGNGADDPALPDDIREASKLTGENFSKLIAVLPELTEQERSTLLHELQGDPPEADETG